MKEKIRLMLATILGGGPGAVGDVNIGRLPLWFLYGYMGLAMIWLHMPKVILRKTYQDLKQEKENNEYYVKWMNEERDKVKIAESIVEQIELELRKRGELSILRDIQKNVKDPDWDFPKYRYRSEESTKPNSISSSPTLNGKIRRHDKDDFE